ncbi:hypothetical protein [Nocardia stercoris]|uniref:hypothetical protein n=1 Tax=Nocardia stercoris TaxID=2483361 RepID=UPI0011C4ACB5|nr:hypothetical protein [Nocardia stercoris]
MRHPALTTMFAGTAALVAIVAPAATADPLTGSAAAGAGSVEVLPLAVAGSADGGPLAAAGSAAAGSVVAPIVLPILGSVAAGAFTAPPAPDLPAAPVTPPAPTTDGITYDWNQFESLSAGDCFTGHSDGTITVTSCTRPHTNQVYAVLHSDATDVDALDLCDATARRTHSIRSTVPSDFDIEAYFSVTRTDKVVCTVAAPDGSTYHASYVG